MTIHKAMKGNVKKIIEQNGSCAHVACYRADIFGKVKPICPCARKEGGVCLAGQKNYDALRLATKWLSDNQNIFEKLWSKVKRLLRGVK